MPARMVDLVAKCSEPVCDRIAHVEVRNERNEPLGIFCCRHGAELVARLNAEPTAPLPETPSITDLWVALEAPLAAVRSGAQDEQSPQIA